MTQYALYRNLARAIYDLALDAVQSRNLEKLALVESIARTAFKPLREELAEHTPIFGVLEHLATPKVVDDDWWSLSLDNLNGLKETYPEILA